MVTLHWGTLWLILSATCFFGFILASLFRVEHK